VQARRHVCRVADPPPTGCALGSSATLLRCELGGAAAVPSPPAWVRYWLHVSHEAWFAPLLPSFRGRGPLKRLRNTAGPYGLTETAAPSTRTPGARGARGSRRCRAVHSGGGGAARPPRARDRREAERPPRASGPALGTRGRLPCEVRGCFPGSAHSQAASAAGTRATTVPARTAAASATSRTPATCLSVRRLPSACGS
jgi:hypothetical protein